ncbi:hypothetical protein GGX14DRAFT_373116 [Mycena pura]|uniref:Uncharacterized protein n=1 Tax=Mycena pura TaxID=153505 RepID=A0AAD6V0C2_9AGAR|nr:hypothetical protein GGX14DRAFT_373116 [Mycena pura]
MENPSPRAFGAPPDRKLIDAAIEKLHGILHPKRGPNTKGYKDPGLPLVLRARLELMLSFLRLYAADGYTGWGKAADTVAKAAGNGAWMSRRVREWVIEYIKDDTHLPHSQYGKHNESVLDDEDVSSEIHLHLQSLGKHISAQDVVNFVSSEEMKRRLNLKNAISVRTAERWMKRNEYRWKPEPKGMYKDGHEREDIVQYRQHVFLPLWAEWGLRTRRWTKKGGEEGGEATADNKLVVIWRHDESIFYAHDRRKLRWVHSSESATPYAKGEGKSMMAIAFVSPDHGWAARKLIRPGKNRDGYYGNADILKHATEMMDWLDEHHQNETHVFAYDNATNHTARAVDALSARKMPVNTPGVGKTGKNGGVQKNWLIESVDSSGKKSKIRMRDAKFADGTPQALYFPRGHPKAGIFKGMRVLIQERRDRGANLPDPTKLHAECKNFKCPPGREDCCCRRVMFTQPDFVNQKSKLEEHCEARGDADATDTGVDTPVTTTNTFSNEFSLSTEPE